MTIKQLIERIRQAKKEIIANREADTLRICLDQAALIKLRLQQQGIDSEGAAWPDYTARYKKERQNAGYQVAFVDFTRSGQFLQSFQPVVIKSDLFTCVVEIRPNSQEMKTRLRGLEGKRPGIFQPSDEEIELVREANRKRLFRYLQF
jgi:hypothetical protein